MKTDKEIILEAKECFEIYLALMRESNFNIKMSFQTGYIAGYKSSLQQDNWISVDDRLPENHELVNIILNSGAITVGRISSKFTHWICFTIKGVLNLQVTHWQTLPNPPNK
jgi:hypothetical protein